MRAPPKKHARASSFTDLSPVKLIHASSSNKPIVVGIGSQATLFLCMRLTCGAHQTWERCVGKFYAVSTVDKDKEHLIRALQREMIILEKLKTRSDVLHGVRLHGSVQINNHSCMAKMMRSDVAMLMTMPVYLGDVFELARNHDLDDVTRFRIAHQISGAIAHAHSKYIVHFDLKPENCLYRRIDGHINVCVADWSMALPLDVTRTVCLPYAAQEYAPPEALFKFKPTLPRYDATRAEVWSLGAVILYIFSHGQLRMSQNEIPSCVWSIVATGEASSLFYILEQNLPDTSMRLATMRNFANRYPFIKTVVDQSMCPNPTSRWTAMQVTDAIQCHITNALCDPVVTPCPASASL